MTMPHERMRSLRWGWELLEAMQHDASLPAESVQRAANLLLNYPAPDVLAALVGPTPPMLSTTVGSSIDSARELFQRVQYGGHGSAETRAHVKFTLRHFPMKGEVVLSADVPGLGGLKSWLAAEE